jgi:hypothetical protein
MTQPRIKKFNGITQLEAKKLHHLEVHGYLILLSFLESKIFNHDHCKDHYIIQLTKDFLLAKAFLKFLNRQLLFLHPKLKKHEILEYRKRIIRYDPHHLLYHLQEYFHY